MHDTDYEQIWEDLKKQVEESYKVSESMQHDESYTEGRLEAIAFKKGMAGAYSEVLEMMFIKEELAKYKRR